MRQNFADWFWAEEKSRENYLQGMWRELGIDPNDVPDYIESGPVELPDQGLTFNQAIWQVLKPFDLKDEFVRIRFHKSLSPNLNQHCYMKGPDGKPMEVSQDMTGKTFIITVNKLAQMLGKGWQSAVQTAMQGAPQ